MSIRFIFHARSLARSQPGRAIRRCAGLESLFAVLTIACTLVASNLLGQQSKPSEYQVKAVYLFNFGRFVDWSSILPAAGDDSFAVCVIGHDPFGRTLDSALAGELIEKRKVIARRISRPQDAATCQVLFISSSEDSRLKDILPLLDKVRVLTVSDMPRFSVRGGMIQFVLDKDKIRFEVNLTNAERAGLNLSSELLKVAIAVKRNS
jgi:YfiR/HmsC-like